MAGRRSFGSVRRLPSGRWQALYTHPDNGRRVTGPVTFTTKAAAHSGDTPTKTVWRRAWDRARRATGVQCSFHDLRHVAGTLNAAAGATTKEAMARLGHASPDAALRYQHAMTERDHEIAAAVDQLARRI